MTKVSYDLNKIKNPRNRRLAREHIALDELCSKTDKISYEVTASIGPVPEAYLIHYNLRSIVGIDENQDPVYGYRHTVEITLPKKYPMEGAMCYAKSDLWHPNIKSDGRYKGRICGNTKEFGSLYDLNMLVLRVGEILQYKNYHALPTAPYPEDEKVARWIRDHAEPNMIINKDYGIVSDNSSLIGDEPTGVFKTTESHHGKPEALSPPDAKQGVPVSSQKETVEVQEAENETEGNKLKIKIGGLAKPEPKKAGIVIKRK